MSYRVIGVQIWIDAEKYLVNVSTHGYFIVFSKRLPSTKFARKKIWLYKGIVDELSMDGASITYDIASDDIVIKMRDGVELVYAEALESKELSELVRRWIDDNGEMLEDLEEEAMSNYNEVKDVEYAVTSDGVIVKIGDLVEYEGDVGVAVWMDDYIYIMRSRDGVIVGISRDRFSEIGRKLGWENDLRREG